ncbi:hypothetical protein TNCV_3779491 [Trichonephila clavipes]|nr:hypothetical protein TNCV_3779491 [Trichonephila clavipes]
MSPVRSRPTKCIVAKDWRFTPIVSPTFEHHTGHVDPKRFVSPDFDYHAVKALYIYKHPYLLRDSNPELSASLTTIPDGQLSQLLWPSGHARGLCCQVSGSKPSDTEDPLSRWPR